VQASIAIKHCSFEKKHSDTVWQRQQSAFDALSRPRPVDKMGFERQSLPIDNNARSIIVSRAIYPASELKTVSFHSRELINM
jgi:hypothetical protein